MRVSGPHPCGGDVPTRVVKWAACVLVFAWLTAGTAGGIYVPGPAAWAVSGQGAEFAYGEAKASYDHLRQSRRLRSDRTAWLKVIGKFRNVYLHYPENEAVASGALFLMARCYQEIFDTSRSRKDAEDAIMRFEVLVEKFPGNPLADDALYALGDLYRAAGEPGLAGDAWKQILQDYPDGEQAAPARERLRQAGISLDHATALGPGENREEGEPAGLSSTEHIRAPAPGEKALVLGVRHWSDADYTRVVIDISGPVHYTEGSLPQDRKKGLPKRLYLDIAPAVKGGDLHDLDIQDGLLKGVRVAQFDPNTVRVVCDLGSTQKTKTFFLEDPFRVVVDAFGKDYPQGPSCPPPAALRPDRPTLEQRAGPLSLAQQLGLCVRRVVVDAGHGGKDPGAIGPTGLREKDVVLKIAKKVAQRLEKRLGCDVVLTRSGDVFLPLEQRTAIANSKKADLFVSIHTNASPRRRMRGVETYFLNFAVDQDAMRVAALENATSTRRIADLQKILNDIMKNAKVHESSRLARRVQRETVANLRRIHGDTKDLGVKQAPFFVLVGARMPSILAEVSFISNRIEERRLRENRYLDSIADGIVRGIESYARDTETAHLGRTH